MMPLTRANSFPCCMLIHVKHRGAQPIFYIYWAQERLGFPLKRLPFQITTLEGVFYYPNLN